MNVTKEQMDKVVGALSETFGGMVRFGYESERGTYVDVPPSASIPNWAAFVSRCNAIAAKTLGEKEVSFRTLRIG